MQLAALTLPRRAFTVGGPFYEGAETFLRQLKDELGIDHIVTGNIAEVNDRPNWIHEQTGLDLFGEEGEYRTVVLDSLSFRQGVEIRSFSVRLSGSVAYVEFQECELSSLRPRR